MQLRQALAQTGETALAVASLLKAERLSGVEQEALSGRSATHAQPESSA
jgi:hypothetical protein